MARVEVGTRRRKAMECHAGQWGQGRTGLGCHTGTRAHVEQLRAWHPQKQVRRHAQDIGQSLCLWGCPFLRTTQDRRWVTRGLQQAQCEPSQQVVASQFQREQRQLRRLLLAPRGLTTPSARGATPPVVLELSGLDGVFGIAAVLFAWCTSPAIPAEPPLA